eukprot:jgi/Galph1/5069/GphlegSOOS_G3704.1
MSSDVLYGIPEIIEKGTGGFAAEVRQRHVNNFSSLGPVDLVCISKHWRGVVGKGVTQGYFHFVRGLKADDAASISTYLGRLIKHGLEGASWYSGGGYKIVSATCRLYNAFSKCDLLVKVEVPGSVSSLAVFADGHEEEPNDLLWEETFVCSVLRASEGVGEYPLYPCLVAFTPLDSALDEKQFLQAARDLVERWPLVGSGRPGLSFGDNPSPITPATRSLLDPSINTSNKILEQARNFFEQDASVKDPELKYYACLSLIEQGDLTAARSMIDSLLQECPNSSLVLTISSRLYAETGQLDAAFTDARKAVSLNEKDTLACIHLASLYVDKGDLAEALISLNSAIMEPPVLDPFLREILPARKRMTKPSSNHANGTDIIRVLAKRLHEEHIGPSTGVDESLAELSATLMTEPEKEAYKVLVKCLNKYGWDEILNARSEAFIMEADIARSSEQVEDSSEHTTKTTNIEESGGASMDTTKTESNEKHETNLSSGAAHTNEDVQQTNNNQTNDTLEDKNVITQNDSSVASASTDVEPKIREVGRSSEERISKRKQIPMEVTSSSGRKKKMCTPWLDFLVNNMYEDLRALAIWQAEDEQMSQSLQSNTNATTHSSTESGTTDMSSNAYTSSEEQHSRPGAAYLIDAESIAKQTKRPPVDWLRRGELARRFQRTSDAERALRVAIILSSKNAGAEKSASVSPWLSLLEMYAEDGFASEALIAADAVWNFMDSHADRLPTSTFTPPVPQVRRAIFKLVNKHGLHKIREQVMDKKISINRHRIQSVLLDAVEWKVSGYDR